MNNQINSLYEFGPFRLNVAERVLLRDGDLVPLTPKAFETLVALVRNSGHVVEKDDLLKEVWRDTFVEEATLAQNIFTLRKALGKDQQYIETIPKRGYRFTADVRELVLTPSTQIDVKQNGSRTLSQPGGANGAERAEVLKAAPGPDVLDVTPAAAPQDLARRQGVEAGGNRREKLILAAAILVAAAGLAFGIFQLLANKKAATRVVSPFQSMEITRLPITGKAVDAAISPDGRYVVYSENDAGRTSLWVKQVATTGNAQQIVPPSDMHYRGLGFSRDGEYVFYVALRPGNEPAVLYQVPVLGGGAKKLVTDIRSPVTFSPDGKRMAFSRFDPAQEEFSLVVANADGTSEEKIASRKLPDFIGSPAWSPDGKVIACAVTYFDPGSTFMSVVEVRVSDGAERPLTSERWADVGRMAWLSDGSGLVLNVTEQELSPSQIWRLSYPGGEAQKITNDLNSYYGMSITSNSTALVALQTDRVSNVWVAPSGDASRATQVTSGTGKFDGFYGVAWAPDGRIVYTSIASGAWDIWIMDHDGSNPKQLTSDARANYGPSVSADGRYIVFVSNRAGGGFNVWRMDIDGGNPKQLTDGEAENFAHCTPDGKWVIYATVGFRHKNLIWKVPIDGGDPVAITDKPSSWPFLSPDGKLITCTYFPVQKEPAKLALVSIDGGPPLKMFDIPHTFMSNTVFHPDGRGVDYLDNRGGISNIWSQPLEGGPPRQITDFKINGVGAYDWSPGGKQLVCSRTVETTGVVLIKNFR